MTVQHANAPHVDAVDAEVSRRPGVPMETEPRRAGDAHWEQPERQPATTTVLTSASRGGLTPVFSSATPPRGLSGAIRRAAYGLPEQRVSHWMLLLLADRVDALEHGAWRPIALGAPLLVAAGLGAVALTRSRRAARWLRA